MFLGIPFDDLGAAARSERQTHNSQTNPTLNKSRLSNCGRPVHSVLDELCSRTFRVCGFCVLPPCLRLLFPAEAVILPEFRTKSTFKCISTGPEQTGPYGVAAYSSEVAFPGQGLPHEAWPPPEYPRGYPGIVYIQLRRGKSEAACP